MLTFNNCFSVSRKQLLQVISQQIIIIKITIIFSQLLHFLNRLLCTNIILRDGYNVLLLKPSHLFRRFSWKNLFLFATVCNFILEFASQSNEHLYAVSSALYVSQKSNYCVTSNVNAKQFLSFLEN